MREKWYRVKTSHKRHQFLCFRGGGVRMRHSMMKYKLQITCSISTRFVGGLMAKFFYLSVFTNERN